MPQNWNAVLRCYINAFNYINNFGEEVIVGARPANNLQRLSVEILNRVQVNLKNCQPLIEEANRNHISYCSLALLQRALISDIISYRYLEFLCRTQGELAMNVEIHKLDNDFAEAFDTIVRTERILPDNPDPDISDQYRNILRRALSEHYNEAGEIRRQRSKPEKGRLDDIDYVKKEAIRIMFKYLSQFQHFSTHAKSLHHEADTDTINRQYSMLILEHVVDMIRDVIDPIIPQHAEHFRGDLVQLYDQIQGNID